MKKLLGVLVLSLAGLGAFAQTKMNVDGLDPYGEITYVYDEQGRVIEERDVFAANNGADDYLDTYKYDDQGRLIEHITGTDTKWTLKRIYTYYPYYYELKTIQSNGITIEEANWIEGDKRIYYEDDFGNYQTVSYDEFGNMTVNRYGDEDDHKLIIYENDYDENGNLIRVRSYRN